MLKAKEREVDCLMTKMSEKDELLRKYCCQIEELKKDLKSKCKNYGEILKQLKAVRNEGSKPCDENPEKEPCESDDVGELLNAVIINIEDQRKLFIYQLQSAESEIKSLAAENKLYLKERNEIASQLQCLRSENDRLLKEKNNQKKYDYEKEELLKTVTVLKSEKNDLLEKINILHENIQELDNNFKETRWALSSEVAEKHDQVQELKRCVGVLEERLRQADMQTHFKDDIIKELRKELKASRKSERRGLYDVVNELRERKNELSKSHDMNKCQSGVTCSNTAYCSATSVVNRQDTSDGKKNTNESEKFLFQIDCLKKNLKLRMEELKDQEEITRDLEEELSKTKMNLAVIQEKYERQERRCKSLGESSTSESDLKWHHATLVCAVNKIEETLQNLLVKHKCGLSDCKIVFETEMEKIHSVKIDLEKNKSKCQSIKCNERNLEEPQPCSSSGIKCNYGSSSFSNQCNFIPLEDLEKFREKSVVGVVTLEQMKEQIDILENLIKKYTKEFLCDCDMAVVEECEDKLEKLHAEFDKLTSDLCQLLQKMNKPSTERSYGSLSFDDVLTPKENENKNSQNIYSVEELYKLKCDYQRLQKQVYDQENAVEKLKKLSKQLDGEIQQKQDQLIEHAVEMDSEICEISKLRELIRKVCRRLKEIQCDSITVFSEEPKLSSTKSLSNLSGLFCDLKEFWCILEESMATLFDDPKKLREDNEKLKEQLGCLKKCVCNKEETVRFLQDTIKLKECQIEDLKSKMQTSENQSSKLAQVVEEKCRLIASLQEAIRKCKQFEVYMELVESLRFEYCELEGKLERYEKEIILKDQKLENLQFEKTVNELQEELTNKECEIKELKTELESEFKKCEDRAAEDSKCIEELSLTVKNFENELYCAQENYNTSIREIESRLKKEHEKREAELNNKICRLETEIKTLKNQLKENANKNDSMADLECIIKQAESQQEIYERKIIELQKTLESIAGEHEEEKKNILQKLRQEKKENLKNKNLITELNENVKSKMLHEEALQERINHYLEDIENLKGENQDLKTEIEARKKIMCAMERDEGTNLTELEELICSLKIQKTKLKARCYSLKSEVDKEIKLKRLSECRVKDLNSMLENKMQEFNQIFENYKCTSSRIQQTYSAMKEVEEKLICSLNNARRGYGHDEVEEPKCLEKLVDVKTAENAKLLSQIQMLKVEIESIRNENAAVQATKDVVISRLQHEIECLENDLQEFQSRCHKLNEENKKLHSELECCVDKVTEMQTQFRERQKDLCEKLRTTICEKNELLSSLEEMRKQLEKICLENANNEKKNRELTEECSRLKINIDSNDSYLKNKSEKIICNLREEVKNLHCQLFVAKENFDVLNEEYQALLEEFKCCEKEKYGFEKLYIERSNENKELMEVKANYEKKLCELKTDNSLLKDKLASKGDSFNNSEEKKKMREKIRDLTARIRTLEKKVIPELEQKITEKLCCIENLKLELREANISNQRMRSEASRMLYHTRRYLAAQKCATDSLETRLKKRGNKLGMENKELEELLKAVTRMSEFLLCQLESIKDDTEEVEPRSFSPLPWDCSTVEMDTSSDYLAESGFQSMQPSPTNLDCIHESQCDSKRNNSQWSSLKKYKWKGSAECPSRRNGVR